MPPSAERRMTVVEDAAALAERAAEELTQRALDAVSARGRFAIALSGGSTPKRLYALLVDPGRPFRARLPWQRMHLFWGDERHVPPDDPQSNFRMVREELLSKVEIPAGNVHRIEGELPDAAEAATRYEAELRRSFALPAPGVPRFDLMLLGLGPEGHTASLFPGTMALAVRDRLVVSNWVAKFDTFRITLTLPVFARAAAVTFLISGRDKAPILAAVLGPKGADPYPAQLIAPEDGEVAWLVDRPAAALLEPA